MENRQPTVAFVVGCLFAHLGCASPPAHESAPARAAEPEGARTTDEVEAVRAECRQLSEACVQKATELVKTHPDVAVRVFSDACDANIAGGCAELGQAYSEGGVLPQDGKRADDAFAKACRLDPSWCD